jgi:hypothetical protein
MRRSFPIQRCRLRRSSRSAQWWIGPYACQAGNHPWPAEARMTATTPVQLHLFDATPDPATIPPDRRRRLLTLTGALLSEAAHDVEDRDYPSATRETQDE